MPEPLNILRVITWLPRGGVEKKILAVAPRLDRELFNVRVLCLKRRGELADAIEEAGVPVDVIPFKYRLQLSAIRKFSAYLQEHKIDLIHAHMYRAAVPSTLAGRLAGTPAIVTQVHNTGTWETRRQVWMDRFLCRWRSGMVAVSGRVKRDIIGALRVPEDFVHVIYNGVDLTQFEPASDPAEAKRREGFDPESIVILMAARLVEQKNPQAFLEAARRLAPKFPNAVFALAGSGKLEHELRAAAEKAGLGDQFRMLGWRDDLASVYQAADVFVLPSYKEGFTNALVEAMASKLAIAATDVGGNAEALEDGRCGLIVPPGDVDKLTDEVEGLVKDEARRRTLGDSARARAERFSLARMIADVESYYLELTRQD